MRLPIQIQAIPYRKTNTKTQYLLLKRISSTEKNKEALEKLNEILSVQK